MSTSQNSSAGKKLTAIYVRQSRASTSDYSSCESQAAICFDFAKAHHWPVLDFYKDEGQSSESLDRPAFKKLAADIEAGEICRVIVYAIDRLSRRIVQLNQVFELFDKHNVELTVIKDPDYGTSAASRLASNIIAAASEFQLEMTRERMSEMRAALKAKGKRVAGRVPFGYTAAPITKMLTPHPDQAPIIRNIFKLASDGCRPSEIASTANLSKWKYHDGEVGRWTASRITKLLSNPTYAGLIRNGKETMTGEHQPIVSMKEFDTVRQNLKSRQTCKPKRNSPARTRNPFRCNLLGLLICASCNRPMSTSVSHRGPFRYNYYRCRSNAQGRPPCPGVNVSVYQLERYVCKRLGDVDDSSSAIPLEFRKRWKELDNMQQRRNLPDVICRIEFDYHGGSITIEMPDDPGSRLSPSTK